MNGESGDHSTDDTGGSTDEGSTQETRQTDEDTERAEEDEKPRYYYLPRSQFDRSRLPEILEKMHERNQEADLGYIN